MRPKWEGEKANSRSRGSRAWESLARLGLSWQGILGLEPWAGKHRPPAPWGRGLFVGGVTGGGPGRAEGGAGRQHAKPSALGRGAPGELRGRSASEP